MSREAESGPQAPLSPEESVVVLIDHQPLQFASLQSHEPTMVVNNVAPLANAAEVSDVPTILTTVPEERGGYLTKGLRGAFPEQKPSNCTLVSAWEGERVVDAVKATGRKKMITTGLRTEICVAMPATQATGGGFEVLAVTDASGGPSKGAYDMAVLGEWQRDWAREKTVPGTVEVQAQHGGASGSAFSRRTQFLTVGDGSEV
ncbi:isochorismatase family protein [Streptomyces sp. SudanB66_2053]|uniref:isochorismatase family protein n=1 Tax=Streptomyces sp. SudanB66_2053 TaxID=3035277 RepID=UPI003F55F253